VGVVGRRQTGADGQELPDAHLTGQAADGAAQEAVRGTGRQLDSGKDLAVRVARRAVDLVVVLAAQPVVPDSGRVRHGGVDPGPDIVRGEQFVCRFTCHRGSPSVKVNMLVSAFLEVLRADVQALRPYWFPAPSAAPAGRQRACHWWSWTQQGVSAPGLTPSLVVSHVVEGIGKRRLVPSVVIVLCDSVAALFLLTPDAARYTPN